MENKGSSDQRPWGKLFIEWQSRRGLRGAPLCLLFTPKMHITILRYETRFESLRCLISALRDYILDV